MGAETRCPVKKKGSEQHSRDNTETAAPQERHATEFRCTQQLNNQPDNSHHSCLMMVKRTAALELDSASSSLLPSNAGADGPSRPVVAALCHVIVGAFGEFRVLSLQVSFLSFWLL